MRLIKFCALFVIYLAGSPSSDYANAKTETESLVVTAAFDGQTLSPQSQLEMRINRAIQPSEGALAVFVGSTDVTGLIETTATSLRYRPWPLPLPAGETKVTVYLIAPNREWRQLAQFTLRVMGGAGDAQPQAPDQPQPPAEGASQPAPEATPAQSGFTVIPGLAIAAKSQPGSWYEPGTARHGRAQFTDFTLQGSLKTSFERRLFGMQSQFDIVGSSYQPEALRYGVLGARAPRIDLSNYLMRFKLGSGHFNAGHINYGSNRYLINSFASRGLSLSQPLGPRADFSVAAMNGTNTVGWGNLFGLDRRDHQVVSGRFGYEVIEKRPGGLRLEASVLSGSLLPLTGVNQNQINDAEKSRGIGLSLSATDKAQRMRFDAGFTRSRSVNPHDPLLDPAQTARGVMPATSDARYFDFNYRLFQDVAVTEGAKASLQINFQHERVDPMYRSVAADTQGNKMLNQVGLVANIGEVTATYSHARFNDNLDDIPSLLTTLTRRHNFTISAPLASLFGPRAADQSQTQPSMWAPQLSFTYDRTRQFGAGVPMNSEFKVAQLPNQLGVNYLLTAEWQSQRWRYSYRLNYSTQTNFGANRADTRLNNLVNGLTLGFNPHSAFDINFDVSLENVLNEDNNDNKDRRRDDRTLRFGFFANWRPTSRITVTANFSNTGMRSFGDLSLASSSRNMQFDAQCSWRFLGRRQSEQEPAMRFMGKLQGQWYVRYSHRYARSQSELQKLYDFNRGNTFNSGLSFTIF